MAFLKNNLSNILSTFNKTKADLEVFIQDSEKAIEANEVKVAELLTKKNTLVGDKAKAATVLDNVKKILGE